MYPPGSLVSPGAQDGLQQHPGLQYLKSQSAVSPLVPPLAFHSMMLHRQLLAASPSPHHFYRHPGGAALYGDLLHHLYPLSTLPPPQLSSVHPSTRLWGERMICFSLSIFILRNFFQLLFLSLLLGDCGSVENKHWLWNFGWLQTDELVSQADWKFHFLFFFFKFVYAYVYILCTVLYFYHHLLYLYFCYCCCILICTMLTCMCSQISLPLSVTMSQVVALDVWKVEGNREKPFVYCVWGLNFFA